MSSVDKVKKICKELKIPISKLEKDLGFSNGYIGQLRKGVFPSDRLVLIANYLNVAVIDLTDDSDKSIPSGYYLNPETASVAQEIFDNRDMRVLFDAARNASPEDLKTATNVLKALMAKEKGYDGDDPA